MKLATSLTLFTAVLAAPLAAPAPDVAPAVAEGSASAAYSAILSVVSKQSSKFSALQKRELDEEDRYIVVFDSEASVEQIAAEIAKLDALVDQESSNGITSALDLSAYNDGSGFLGFVGKFNSTIVNQLNQSPILTVEQDTYVPEPKFFAEPVLDKRAIETDENPPNWGLGRISHKQFQGEGNETYVRETTAKHSTVAYVVDSGVRITHEMFQGRAVWGANLLDDIDEDLKGHGSHVAGTLGGKDYGVDVNTKIVAVKVFGANGGGPQSVVNAGFTWALNDFIKNRNKVPRGVLNYSGGGSVLASQDVILARAVKEGLVVVTSAGNDAKDACTDGPANNGAKTHGFITVASLNEHNVNAYDSNWGTCVDVWAPGSKIPSASHKSDTGIVIMRGTSMASPHVAGLATYYMSISDKTLSPGEVEDLITKSNTDVLTFDLKGSPNAVAYNGNGQ
ncbi:peptidase S8/S53 domain-containing protein [Yarrowia lipolytica]|nr:peptidase S8/S53 domain-containing protein [Yarrowia lipolytica]RDW39407.1 peptidase S8/S53 domain-containing protein [Yarrowia lipolytica]